MTQATSASFTFTADEPASFECALDNDMFSECRTEYTGLADGQHRFQVRATDSAGNTDATPAAYSWTVDTTAPVTTITDGPDALTKLTTASITFTANEPASFECALDNDMFSECRTEYTGLTDGQHRLQVRATDRVGNTDATPAAYSWTVDTTAPVTTITDGPDALTKLTTASITFTADEPASFECALDNDMFSECRTEYTGLTDGQHRLQVRATDRVGNTDATPAAYSWTVDTTAPQTTISDAPPVMTSATSARFSFTADEPATFECALDTDAFSECRTEYTGLTDGQHRLQVRATDSAGNTDATPASYSWTVDTTTPDTTAPDTTITVRPPSQSNSATASFTFTADEPASFECALDSDTFSECRTEYTDLADGQHHLHVRATDAAGNTDATPATYSWTVDTTAPQTTITDPHPDTTSGAAARFVFSADEPGSTFECALDEAPFGPCSSPREYTDLRDGQHRLQVRATDSAGNTDATPATYSWIVSVGEASVAPAGSGTGTGTVPGGLSGGDGAAPQLPAADPALDARSPELKLRAPRSIRASALRRGAKLAVTASENGRIVAQLRTRGGRVLARAKATARAGERTFVRLRARESMAGRRLTLHVTAIDLAGNRRTISRHLRVTAH